MPLSYNLQSIEGYKSLCYDDALDENGKPVTDDQGKQVCRINRTTEYLIFSTMLVGIGEIDERSALEFHQRLTYYERVFNAARHVNHERHETTYEEVVSHIGLKTNASNQSQSEFIQHCWDNYKRETRMQLQREGLVLDDQAQSA